MEQKLYISNCPVCGRALFKGLPNSYIEGGCPKCKNYIRINYTDTGVVASVSKLVRDANYSDGGSEVK